MFYLAIHMVAATLFSLCYKVAQRHRDCHTPAVHLAMYVSALTLTTALLLVRGNFISNTYVIVLGLIAGISLLVAMKTFFLAMKQGGLAIGWTMVNLGVFIPLLASIFIWNEIPNKNQLIGFFLMTGCVVLFGDPKVKITGDKKKWWILVIIATLTTGVVQLASKAIAIQLASSDIVDGKSFTLNYMVWIFITGLVFLSFQGEWRNCKIKSVETRIGLLMGIFNTITFWSFVKALEYIPATVFFPLKSILGIFATAILAVLIWKERLNSRQVIGIILGGLAVFFINLK